MVGILRSVAGVVAGYVLFAVSAVLLFQAAGRNPHAPQDPGFVLLSAVYGMAFAALGGYLAGLVAGRKPRQHATALALVIALGATVSFLSQGSTGSRWSQLAAIFLMAPAAWLGGVVRSRRNAG